MWKRYFKGLAQYSSGVSRDALQFPIGSKKPLIRYDVPTERFEIIHVLEQTRWNKAHDIYSIKSDV